MSRPGANMGAMGGLGGMSLPAEVRSRLWFLLLAFLVFRIGAHVPVPGIDPVKLAAMFAQNKGTILDIFNMFSGGALERLSIFALGVMPYISASIIVQLLAVVVPSLEAIKKEGESGRRKLTRYTRFGTLGLALFQGLGAAYALQNQGIAITSGPGFLFTATITLVTGTMFLMWLGEQITERGIGNGISMLIFAGIVAGLPAAIGGTLELVRTGELNALLAISILAAVLVVTWGVVFVERGQRRITVNYAKRQVGRRMYAGQQSHLPFKLNMSGVIPPIFASSLILFPATIASWMGTSEGSEWLRRIAATLSPGNLMHDVLYAALIAFFCFFYTALVFNSKETADNLKKSGAFIPGIRPGQQTAEFIDKVLTRLTLWGAVYVVTVCLIPQFLITYAKVPFYFGGTSLLIMVVVVMDFFAQLQAHMMSHQYESLLKKANLKGVGQPR
jgi:preprotein translocase subunit SecY